MCIYYVALIICTCVCYICITIAPDRPWRVRGTYNIILRRRVIPTGLEGEMFFVGQGWKPVFGYTRVLNNADGTTPSVFGIYFRIHIVPPDTTLQYITYNTFGRYAYYIDILCLWQIMYKVMVIIIYVYIWIMSTVRAMKNCYSLEVIRYIIFEIGPFIRFWVSTHRNFSHAANMILVVSHL